MGDITKMQNWSEILQIMEEGEVDDSERTQLFKETKICEIVE